MIDFDKLARESGADRFEFHSAYGYTFLPEQWEDFVQAIIDELPSEIIKDYVYANKINDV